MTEEERGSGVPGWFVTFSDLMALLLTFFIMLVSFSELKSEEKYQALMDGFQQQFGNFERQSQLLPGQLRPRNTKLSKWASNSLSERRTMLPGDPQVVVRSGDRHSGQPIRLNQQPVVGTVLYFHEDQIELDDSQRSRLQQQADALRGRPQRVEIRGHTWDGATATGTPVRDHWDLSFERCRRVMQYLVEEQHMDSRMLRLSTAAANEPSTRNNQENSDSTSESQVELILLDETGSNQARISNVD